MRRSFSPLAALLAALLLVPSLEACKGHSKDKGKAELKTIRTSQQSESGSLNLAVSEAPAAMQTKATELYKAKAKAGCSKGASLGASPADAVHSARLSRIQEFVAKLKAKHAD
jgi:hypothetical protein